VSNAAKSKKINNLLKPQIVFEDSSILVVNKPAGWVTLNVPSFSGPTIQDWLEKEFKLEKWQLESETSARQRSGIVHRLDKDTWGLLLVAKSNQGFNDLQQQFKQRQVRKIYWALVRGELKGDGEIVAPIDRAPYDGTQFDVVPGGKSAHTIFRVIKHYSINGQVYSLVRVRLKTGRTHQIRVHFKYLGHPLFGDPIYGKNEGAMFLVAKEIEFRHPDKNKIVNFKIEIPARLKKVINKADEKKEKEE
jgi:23S rRNA pseudouridine1911/1915/1917 synthase